MRALKQINTRWWVIFVSVLVAWITDIYALSLPLGMCAIKHLSLMTFLLVSTDTILTVLHVPQIKQPHIAKILQSFSVCITLCLILLVIDTFITYACPWFPGMIRYFIIDLYSYYIWICPILSLLYHCAKKK
ncbi:MAG: hypothetical protein HFF02_07130 [Erysipelotrichaceae bacterium]|jgi:hypothetical protein|nr:hypothetical protein [Erysipelotrichaceae bacterium]